MPSIGYAVSRLTRQNYVYWMKTGVDNAGKPAFANLPVQLLCRWEDKQQEILTPDNRKVMSKGFLLTNQNIVVGSLVFLGTLDQVQALPTWPGIPTVTEGVREVLKVEVIPDIKNFSNVYEVYL